MRHSLWIKGSRKNGFKMMSFLTIPCTFYAPKLMEKSTLRKAEAASRGVL